MLALALICATLAQCATASPVVVSAGLKDDTIVHWLKGEKEVEGVKACAVANYTNAVNSTGWGYLEVDTEEECSDVHQVGQTVEL